MEKSVLRFAGAAALTVLFCYVLSSGPVIAYVTLKSNYNAVAMKEATKPYVPICVLFGGGGVRVLQWYYLQCHDVLKPCVHPKVS